MPALALAILSAGCATSLPTLESQEVYRQQPAASPGLVIKTVAEGERVMLVKSPDDLERVCSPRESDEGLSFSRGFNFSVPSQVGTLGIGEDSGDDAIALASPSDLVQLAREMLFRACELTLNLNSAPEQTIAIYDHFLSTFERIAASLPASTADGDDSGDDEDDDSDEPASGDGDVSVE